VIRGRRDKAGKGEARQVWPGAAGQGKAGGARRGKARSGKARQDGEHGVSITNRFTNEG